MTVFYELTNFEQSDTGRAPGTPQNAVPHASAPLSVCPAPRPNVGALLESTGFTERFVGAILLPVASNAAECFVALPRAGLDGPVRRPLGSFAPSRPNSPGSVVSQRFCPEGPPARRPSR